MRDIFYTILVVWILWRILNSLNSRRANQTNQSHFSSRKEGETTVNYVPPQKKSVKETEGEYVDYEEVK